MSEILIYKIDRKSWGVALNPRTSECTIWRVGSKERALEKKQELLESIEGESK